jgi:hypothetical protein
VLGPGVFNHDLTARKSIVSFRELQRSGILASRIFAGTGDSEKYLLSKDNGFLDEAFGNEWEIVREPGIDPAFERRTLVIPLARSSSATRALFASLGHEQ